MNMFKVSQQKIATVALLHFRRRVITKKKLTPESMNISPISLGNIEIWQKYRLDAISGKKLAK